MTEEYPAPAIPPPPISPQQKAPARPVSITLIAIFFFIAGLLEINGLKPDPARTGILPVVEMIDSVVFLVLKLMVGIGLLRMMAWARPAAVIAVIARFVLGNLLMALELFSPLASGLLVPRASVPHAFFIGGWVVMTFFSLALYIPIIIVLLTPGVKAAFARFAR